MKYSYPCVRFRQSSSGKWLVQFAASAQDIDIWAGIPRKGQFPSGGGVETVGFQRQDNPKRLGSLQDFCSNPDNVIQNPLLCALRNVPDSSVSFEPLPSSQPDDRVQHGTLSIHVPDFKSFSFEKSVRNVRSYIEARVPELSSETPSPTRVTALQELASEAGHTPPASSDHESKDLDEDQDDNDRTEDASEDDDSTTALFDESHIVDFWTDIAALDETVRPLALPPDTQQFLNFNKNDLQSYLKPVVLVDGQHRLLGALAAARKRCDDNSDIRDEIVTRLAHGEAEDAVRVDIQHREARFLPISLLMSPDPEEQVFQFVVVNQKATPIGRALLGTIVSTTLSTEEMGKVLARLESAGIQVEDSQAINYLARHKNSPFVDLVERGVHDSKNVLKWNVFASLVSIFRWLKGGRLYDRPRNDYADLWKRNHLPESRIVADYPGHEGEDAYTCWSASDGPWRAVFIEFWTCVRNKLSNTDDKDKPNYWGQPRKSNLFNKVSLTILAADFFQFLRETRSTIESAQQIHSLVDSWLQDVNPGYFDKDWVLGGVKKDSTGIRTRWASLWSDHRKSGRLPNKDLFRRPLNPN